MTIAYNLAPQAAFVRSVSSPSLSSPFPSFPELTRPLFLFPQASLGYTMFAFLFDWTDANWSVSFHPSFPLSLSLSLSLSSLPSSSRFRLSFLCSDRLTRFGFRSFDERDRLLRRKGKMFRFTPSPVSSASIFWWAGKGGFATRKCLFDVGLEKWFDERFPPLSIYYVSSTLTPSPFLFLRLFAVA